MISGFLMSLKISALRPTAWSPFQNNYAQDFYVLKNQLFSTWFQTANFRTQSEQFVLYPPWLTNVHIDWKICCLLAGFWTFEREGCSSVACLLFPFVGRYHSKYFQSRKKSGSVPVSFLPLQIAGQLVIYPPSRTVSHNRDKKLQWTLPAHPSSEKTFEIWWGRILIPDLTDYDVDHLPSQEL